MKHASLFSGFGGFDLAAEWAGWENVLHCEINPFARQILKYYWPNSISYEDITKTDFTKHRGTIDLISGGFPCQPYSAAGLRKGKEDDRHLWPQMLRAIREIQPRWVVGENVRGLTNWNGGLVFDEVQSDLEAEGYEVTPFLLPACGVNAPHERYRIWFVAYAESKQGKRMRSKQSEVSGQKQVESGGRSGEVGDRPTTDSERFGSSRKEHGKTESRLNTEKDPGCRWENFPTQSPICSRDDGIPPGLDGITFSKWRNESIKGYGNAVVPQLVLQIFNAINQFETLASQ